MDPIKEAFSKVRQDISELQSNISILLKEIEDIKRTLNQQTNRQINPSNNLENPTVQQTDISNNGLYGLKSPNSHFSSGNRGVPTDRQTNQQTDKRIPNGLSATMEAVDILKNELKDTFLNLTKQEREVFLLIYDLEEQGFTVDYSMLAQRFNLTESSIRDYVLKMIRKGVPIQKTKENNKKILLSIAPELKRIANRSSFQSLYSVKHEFIG